MSFIHLKMKFKRGFFSLITSKSLANEQQQKETILIFGRDHGISNLLKEFSTAFC